MAAGNGHTLRELARQNEELKRWAERHEDETDRRFERFEERLEENEQAVGRLVGKATILGGLIVGVVLTLISLSIKG